MPGIYDSLFCTSKDRQTKNISPKLNWKEMCIIDDLYIILIFEMVVARGRRVYKYLSIYIICMFMINHLYTHVYSIYIYIYMYMFNVYSLIYRLEDFTFPLSASPWLECTAVTVDDSSTLCSKENDSAEISTSRASHPSIHPTVVPPSIYLFNKLARPSIYLFIQP